MWFTFLITPTKSLLVIINLKVLEERWYKIKIHANLELKNLCLADERNISRPHLCLTYNSVKDWAAVPSGPLTLKSEYFLGFWFWDLLTEKLCSAPIRLSKSLACENKLHFRKRIQETKSLKIIHISRDCKETQ